MSSEAPLIVVLGPTGSGKSDLALAIAEAVRGEIVNCDSVQLYRYMDIGSAKTPPEQRRGVPHHLLDVLSPDEHFTAGEYSREARRVLRDIHGRQRTPVVVGGTGFYLRALLEGLSEAPQRDEALRARLSERSPERLHKLLTRLDSKRANQIHPNDAKKLIRAIELCVLARKPATELFVSQLSEPLTGFHVIKIGLFPHRDLLAERIAHRSQRMFAQGLIEEVLGILEMGYSAESKAMQAIGYREALMCIRGEMSLSEAVEFTTIATRQYAKRQRTWFRRETEVFQIKDFGSLPETQHMALDYLATVVPTAFADSRARP